MNALAQIPTQEPANIVPLPTRKRAPRSEQRFKVLEFANPRTGSKSWRVSGIKRDGTRVRENFREEPEARCRQIELETEFLSGHAETEIRATKLSPEQLQLAEVAVIRLGDDWRQLLDAVEHWTKHGKQLAVVESPRLDDGVKAFFEWLQDAKLDDRTKDNLRLRVGMFAKQMPNLRVAEITKSHVLAYLQNRKIAPDSRDNDRRAISRLFSWCMYHERQWTRVNPCRLEKGERKHIAALASHAKGMPEILTLPQCEKLVRAAEKFKGGKLAPYVAVCLFGGLRPSEAGALTWERVNLKDREILIDDSKTGKPRVAKIDDTLAAWLKRYKGAAFYPANWRKDFDAIKRAVGFGPEKDKEGKTTGLKAWPEDVMRHTAISHFFRDCESYGRSAEHFGNSEAIIKAHYQGRVSSKDTKKFYAILPRRKS